MNAVEKILVKVDYQKGAHMAAIPSRDMNALGNMHNKLMGVEGIYVDRDTWQIGYRPDDYSNLFTGFVEIAGKWMLNPDYGQAGNEIMDAIYGPFAYFKTDGTKPYIRCDFKTLTATEEAGPMPLDGEADARWYRKAGICGDLHASV
jgi:hypothetical protein